MDTGNKLHYFMNQSTRTEIDFIVDGNERVPAAVPIEVKAGTNLRAKSLPLSSKSISQYWPCALRWPLSHVME